jgi:hypothetical protein
MATVTVHGQTCAVTYRVGSVGSVSPGNAFALTNNFTNSGSVLVQVTGIVLTVDFGTFSAPSSSLPLTVAAGTTQSTSFNVQVPSSASVGSHSASVSANIQCNEGGSWVTPSFSPLVISTTMTVAQSPTTLAAIGLAIIGVIVALVVIVIVLVVEMRRKKQAQPTPPPPAPSYVPPSPPPGQNAPGP